MQRIVGEELSAKVNAGKIKNEFGCEIFGARASNRIGLMYYKRKTNTIVSDISDIDDQRQRWDNKLLAGIWTLTRVYAAEKI